MLNAFAPEPGTGTGGSAYRRPGQLSGGMSDWICNPTSMGWPGGNTNPAEQLHAAASTAFVKQTAYDPRARWRASKGAAPVGRFTRSFGNNNTEGWHRSMPVGFAVGGTLYFATLGASLSLTAAHAKEVRDVVAAQMTAAADVVYRLARTLSASVTGAGDTTHQVLRTLVGAIATTATTSTVKLMLRSFGASMTSSGALVRQTSHPIASSLSAAGALSRQARRTVAASLTAAGAFVRQTSRSIAASLSVTGSLSRQVQRTLAASLTVTGALARQAGRAVGASLTASSTVREAIARTMTASMLQTAAVQRSVAATESASLTAGGIVVERTGRLLSAIESATAALGQSSILTLVPDGTPSNTGWTPVGAATIHAALAAGDSDYMQSSSAGSVTEVSLSNPSIGLSLTGGQLTIRVKTG